MKRWSNRATRLGAPLVSVATAAAFFVAARATGEATALAVWGGTVWVFLLSMIVTLPLLAGRRGDGLE